MLIPQIYSRIAASVLTLLHRRTQKSQVIDICGIRVQVCPNVFNPVTGRTTEFFIRHMEIPISADVIEIGTGSGAIAAAAAMKTNSVVATDVNPFAIRCAKRTMELNNVDKRVVLLQGNLFKPVQHQTFDIILFNPPYFMLNTKSWLEKAWGAGSNCELLSQFFSQAPSFLHKKGQVQVLLSSAA
ncbi:MAG: HemK2/MTQ2 family protein methyltransferase, partial [Candidatus Thorarchaeota archaeon]